MNRRDPLNLRSLPEHPVPEEIWSSIDQRLHGSRRLASPAFAIAAAVFVACAVVLWWSPDPRGDAGGAALDRYRSASVLLEIRVDRLKQGAIEFSTALKAGQIEQRLAGVDRELMRAPEDAELWRQRLALLDELARLYAGKSGLAQLKTVGDDNRI